MNHILVSIALSIVGNGLFKTIKYILYYIFYKSGFINHVYYNNNKINIRTNSSDFTIFREIFMDLEYNLQYDKDVSVIIDAGANIGASTVFFADRFPNAQIYAIEPDQENYKLLCKNTEHLKNVCTLNYALWSKRTKLTLSTKEVDGEAGINAKEEVIATSNNTIEGISVSDLTKLKNINKIDLFKMDIEGAEKEVFSEGSLEWLKLTSMFIIETHDRVKKGCSKAIFNALRDYQYNVENSGEKLIINL